MRNVRLARSLTFAVPNAAKVAAILSVPVLMMAGINDPVKLESGAISGVAGSTPAVRIYKGIPYAAPPVGDLRWKAPKAAASWTGVKKADTFGTSCMQVPYPDNSPYATENSAKIGEDCLYLNVWTAAKSAKDKRPVMVWIHGGALTRGSGATPNYDGDKLAQKGVIVVTINYRLGIFGYFAHPELTKESDRNASGNYGFLDQVAALEWVQKNIYKFGGDPKNVTIFGESAGSWSVNVLAASPLTKGLFAKAIGESGGQFGPLTSLADAETAGKRAGTLAELRAKSAAEVMKIQTPTRTIVDGYFLPKDVSAIYAEGKQNDVPLLMGLNNDEGTPFTPASVKADGFKGTAKSRYGDQAEEYLKIYPVSTDDDAKKAYAAQARDSIFGWQMRTWARAQAQTGKSKVFMYYFSKVPPGEWGTKLGAYHASEISYVFDNVKDPTPADQKLEDVMSSYWVNFATTGDPNGKGLPKWPVYDRKMEMAMGLGDKIEGIALPHKEAIDFIDAQNAKRAAR